MALIWSSDRPRMRSRRQLPKWHGSTSCAVDILSHPLRASVRLRGFKCDAPRAGMSEGPGALMRTSDVRHLDAPQVVDLGVALQGGVPHLEDLLNTQELLHSATPRSGEGVATPSALRHVDGQRERGRIARAQTPWHLVRPTTGMRHPFCHHVPKRGHDRLRAPSLYIGSLVPSLGLGPSRAPIANLRGRRAVLL